MELRVEHLKELERVLRTPTKPLPWVVHPEILKEMERLGVCTDGFIAAAPYIPSS